MRLTGGLSPLSCCPCDCCPDGQTNATLRRGYGATQPIFLLIPHRQRRVVSLSAATCHNGRQSGENSMSNQLIIFDTTLRDGEQSPGASMTS
ncbi:MAG TPA: hypothetical protein EYP40_04325, partial [Chromatiales bacterium]|nr:hypothetical protein [Chromatiales bacterium]